jgi:hypothetical protein
MTLTARSYAQGPGVIVAAIMGDEVQHAPLNDPAWMALVCGAVADCWPSARRALAGAYYSVAPSAS